jgi:hypothetical protein
MALTSSADDAQQKARRWRALPYRWALRHAPVATSAERLVLSAYADHCDADGSGAYPGPSTLMSITLLDETTIKRVRRELLARGLVAQGDQSRARKLPSGQRPRVLDLQVPYSWYASQSGGMQALREINAWRIDQGLEPLTPENRPDLAPAPAKKERADKGRRRSTTAKGEGVATRPPSDNVQDGHEEKGGLQDPPRGGYETPQGVATSPPTNSFNLACDPANDISGDGRRPTTGSRGLAEGGFAASDNTSSTIEKPKPAELRTVVEGVPEPLKQLLQEDWPRELPGRVNDLIGAGLTQEHRTPAQLLERMARRWQAFGYEDALLSQTGEGIRRSIGVLEELLSPSKCEGNNIDCEDGIELHTGRECPRCEEAHQDRMGARQQPAKETTERPAVAQPAVRAARRPLPPQREEQEGTFTDEGMAQARAEMRNALRNRPRI